MSRIDDALRRAKEGQAAPPEQPTTGHDAPVAVPESHVFQPAWNLPGEGHAEVRHVTVPAPAPWPHGHDAQANGNQWAGDEDALLQTEGHRPLAIFQGFSQRVVERLALPSNANGTLVEQFRQLAASLHHAQTSSGIRSLMVTSAVVGEGKTLTATNLALTLSESFRRNVLLVDADLRRPSLHEVFQVPNVSGLSDGLKAPNDGKLSLLQITPLLTLLTAGRPDPDPMHSLISDRMKRVIEEARAKFDWVVLDTPPVGLLTDANLLVAMMDAALLVVRAGVAPYNYVERAADIIGRERIIGVLLNAAESQHVRGHEYNYDRYYTAR
jgi:capsular exopolysaccharide synthesis family protein